MQVEYDDPGISCQTSTCAEALHCPTGTRHGAALPRFLVRPGSGASKPKVRTPPNFPEYSKAASPSPNLFAEGRELDIWGDSLDTQDIFSLAMTASLELQGKPVVCQDSYLNCRCGL